ncbi:holo-ACP synthase [Thalassotalea sp. M1531]|uniref:Holo-[acyl-carrier-protein] synthase n=1 Tax=Thalassotalea algicola TaxID=2716224 RepID=A0A7Y0Q6H4_9GAMM|nr:holo-ACP synthase [Thalassotalea algicola]NMP29960.1 holo-ACP synthase [Thalassotalea algicola]
MSVVGIGTDIVEVSRISSMKEAAKERLAKRVLTSIEYQHYLQLTQSDSYLAKRWAAKEAAAKSLGTGIADGVSFQHFTIESLASGAPVLHLSDRALELAKGLGADNWHISISDEKHYALAFVVLSK